MCSTPWLAVCRACEEVAAIQRPWPDPTGMDSSWCQKVWRNQNRLMADRRRPVEYIVCIHEIFGLLGRNWLLEGLFPAQRVCIPASHRSTPRKTPCQSVCCECGPAIFLASTAWYAATGCPPLYRCIWDTAQDERARSCAKKTNRQLFFLDSRGWVCSAHLVVVGPSAR